MEGLFEVLSQDPVIPHGRPGSWDGQFTDPGAATVQQDTIHVLQNGFVGWPAPVGIGHWSSEDGGISWTEVSEEPVLHGAEVPFAGVTALASSLIIEEDGTWVLYFYTWDDQSWPRSASTIGRATAPSPEGPWLIEPDPVLEPGPQGSWDDLAVRVPSVVRTDEGYSMWYTGASSTKAMIGLARSSDGVTWVKHDDPATSDTLFGESDPVLVPEPSRGSTWDQANVHQPRGVEVDDGFIMLYAAVNTVETPSAVIQRHGLAVSRDGVSWARSATPVIAPSNVRGGTAIWFTELLRFEERLLAFLEVGTGGETEVYLAAAGLKDVPDV